MGKVNPTLDQVAFRARYDYHEFDENIFEWGLNESISMVPGGSVRLRFLFEEIAGGSTNNATVDFQYSIDNGPWTLNSATNEIVNDSSFFESWITFESEFLAAGSEGYATNGTPFALSVSANSYIEMEIHVIVPVDLLPGQTVRFRWVGDGSLTFGAYTSIPTITVADPAVVQAHDSDDFGVYPAGASVFGHAGFTDEWVASTSTFEDHPYASASRIIRYPSQGSGRFATSMLHLIEAAVDVDARIRFRLDTETHAGSGDVLRLLVRGSGMAGMETGFIVDVRRGEDAIALRRYERGSLADSASMSYEIPANTWGWLRIIADGTSFKVKQWVDGDVEPGTWGISLTNTNTLRSGWVGIGTFSGLGNRDIDYISIGTEGAESQGIPALSDPTQGDDRAKSTFFDDSFVGEWPDQWNSSNMEIVPVVDAFRGFQSSWMPIGSAARRMRTWDRFPAAEDAEVLTRFRMDESVGDLVRVGARVSGGVGTEQAYFVDFRATSGELGLRRYVAGSLADIVLLPFEIPFDEWTWVRFGVTGSTIRVKVWTEGEPEPFAWLWSDTDTEITGAGLVGIGSFSSFNFDIDYFAASPDELSADSPWDTVAVGSSSFDVELDEPVEETVLSGDTGGEASVAGGLSIDPLQLSTHVSTETIVEAFLAGGGGLTFEVSGQVDGESVVAADLFSGHVTAFPEYLATGYLTDWALQWASTDVEEFRVLPDVITTLDAHLRFKPETVARNAASWETVGEATNVDVVLRLRRLLGAGDAFRVIVRGGGSAGTETGYFLEFDGTEDVVGEGPTIELRRYNAGGLANVASVPKAVHAETVWYIARVRIVDSTIRAKVWPSDEPEPSEWDLTATNADIPGPGWVGIGSFANGTWDIDWMVVEHDEGVPLVAPIVEQEPIDPGVIESTTFANQSVGLAPSGWSEESGWGADGWTVAEELTALDDRTLQGSFGTVAERAISWDAIPAAASGEVYLRFRFLEASGLSLRAVQKAQVTGGQQLAEFMEFNQAAGEAQLNFYSDGTKFLIASVPMAFVVGDWYRARFRIDDRFRRIRVWDDADPEPAAWDSSQIVLNQPTPDRGWVGLGAYDPGSVEVDWVSVTTRDFDPATALEPDPDTGVQYEVAGDVAGVAVVTGELGRASELSGSATAGADAAGELVIEHDLAAAVVAEATVISLASLDHELAATAVMDASVDGDLSVVTDHQLLVELETGSVAVADLDGILHSLLGEVVCEAIASADLDGIQHPLLVQASLEATVAAALDVATEQGLSAAALAEAFVVADLDGIPHPLLVEPLAGAVASGDLDVVTEHPLAGVVATTSDGLGALELVHDFACVADGSSVVTGDMLRHRTFEALAGAETSVLAAMARDAGLQALADAGAGTLGSLLRDVALIPESVTGHASVSEDFEHVIWFELDIVGSSVVASDVGIVQDVTVSMIVGEATVSSALDWRIGLLAVLLGDAQVSVGLHLLPDLAAVVDTASNLLGALERALDLSPGTIHGSSLVDDWAPQRLVDLEGMCDLSGSASGDLLLERTLLAQALGTSEVALDERLELALRALLVGESLVAPSIEGETGFLAGLAGYGTVWANIWVRFPIPMQLRVSAGDGASISVSATGAL